MEHNPIPSSNEPAPVSALFSEQKPAHACCHPSADAPQDAKAAETSNCPVHEDLPFCPDQASAMQGQESVETGCCSHRTKERDSEESRNLINRLNRIEGQIRGIKSMVEKNAYCPDILTQVAAASAALGSFTKVLLASHIRTCVAEDIRNGKEETIDELVTTLQKLMK